MMKYCCAMLIACANSYFIEIDAHKEECFHEKVNSGTKVGLINNSFICGMYISPIGE